MLAAHARLRLGPVALDYDLGLDSRFRLATERREGTIWDTRLANPNSGTGDRIALIVLLEGRVAWHGEAGFALEAPAAFSASTGNVEGAKGRWSRTLRSEGSPFLTVELQVDRELTNRGPEPAILDLSPRVLEAARAYARLVNAGVPVDIDVREAHASAFFRALQDERVLTTDLSVDLGAIQKVERMLWSVLAPQFEQFDVLPSLATMSRLSGLTLRQFGRRFDVFLEQFRFPWTGWREITRGYRLKVAVMLLSNEALALEEVATQCGYSSSEALTHALTTEGLPPPQELRRRILAGTG